MQDRLPPARQNPLAMHGRTIHRDRKAELTISKNDVPLLPRHRTWWLLVVLLVPEGHEPLAGLILSHHREHFGACLGQLKATQTAAAKLFNVLPPLLCDQFSNCRAPFIYELGPCQDLAFAELTSHFGGHFANPSGR
jgi:hypothetical protein